LSQYRAKEEIEEEKQFKKWENAVIEKFDGLL
jgi:hypothetical protein